MIFYFHSRIFIKYHYFTKVPVLTLLMHISGHSGFLKVVNTTVSQIYIEVLQLLLFPLLNNIYFIIYGCHTCHVLPCYTLNVFQFSLIFVVLTPYSLILFVNDEVR